MPANVWTWVATCADTNLPRRRSAGSVFEFMQDASHEQPRAQSQPDERGGRRQFAPYQNFTQANCRKDRGGSAADNPQAKQLAAVCRETAEHALRIESKNFGEVPTA